MDRTELGDVAWELVEHCRDALPEADRNRVFILLGIGDYGDAMVLALRAVAREPNPVLPDKLLRRLTLLPNTHFVDAEFVALLSQLSGDYPQAG